MYCERCDMEYGVKSLLGPRIMPLDEDGKPEPKPADYDEWLQCRGCGTMYRKQEVKQEAKLGDFVETSDNDKKSEITSLYSRGSERGTTAKRLKQKKRKEQLDSIKDEDIKREVKMGGEVTIEEDSTSEARPFALSHGTSKFWFSCINDFQDTHSLHYIIEVLIFVHHCVISFSLLRVCYSFRQQNLH